MRDVTTGTEREVRFAAAPLGATEVVARVTTPEGAVVEAATTLRAGETTTVSVEAP